MKFKYKFIFIFLIFSLFLASFAYFKAKDAQYSVILNKKEFIVEVSRTKAELQKGLSGRESLGENQGMLFVFDKPAKYGFWMIQMNFPIDIIWISDKNKIVYIKKSLSPDTYPNIFTPNDDSLYVLEISAGQSDLLNLQLGDEVKFLKK